MTSHWGGGVPAPEEAQPKTKKTWVADHVGTACSNQQGSFPVLLGFSFHHPQPTAIDSLLVVWWNWLVALRGAHQNYDLMMVVLVRC